MIAIHSQHFLLARHREGRILAAVLRKLGLVFAALALFSMAGGQWTVLQTVAWVGMLHDYTQRTGSFALAAEQTFDGQHPCNLCREIAAAKTKEHQEQPAAPSAKDQAKVKATMAKAAILPPAPPVMFLAQMLPTLPSGSSRTEQPPTPPPRRAADAA